MSLEKSALRGSYTVLARPTAPLPTLTSAILSIDAMTFEVRKVILFDAQSNRNELDFTNFQHNAPVAPGQFVIRPAPTTTFLGPNGQTTLPATCP